MTQRIHEGFTSNQPVSLIGKPQLAWGPTSHVWPWEALESVEFQGSVLRQGRSIDLSGCCELRAFFQILRNTYRFGCTPGLFLSDLRNGTLNLGDIHSLVVNLDDAAQNGTHLGELVLVARDEIELRQGHDGLMVTMLVGVCKRVWGLHRSSLSPRARRQEDTARQIIWIHTVELDETHQQQRNSRRRQMQTIRQNHHMHHCISKAGSTQA